MVDITPLLGKASLDASLPWSNLQTITLALEGTSIFHTFSKAFYEN